VDQSIASLRESREAVKQGENIRILTLITIGYLPVSLVIVRTTPAPPAPKEIHPRIFPINRTPKALFSNSHGILAETASQGYFLWLVLILMVTTFTLAGFLGSLTDLFKFTRKLTARITRPVLQPTRQAFDNRWSRIKKTALYKRYEVWLNEKPRRTSQPNESGTPSPLPPLPPLLAPEKDVKPPVPPQQPSTKAEEKMPKNSGLHRRLFRWRKGGDLDGGSQGRELEVDVERSAVGGDVKA
jgi:hypothetical protein